MSRKFVLIPLFLLLTYPWCVWYATTFTGFNDALNFSVEPGVGLYCFNPLYGETLLCE
ncbi:MAG: hypothetical protein ACTSSE_06570 [Candidatus Thorarchaeota archaeon]